MPHRRIEQSGPPPVYDPFSRAAQIDPYPIYRALLEDVPVYRNQERDFWAVSRFADVQGAFRDWKAFSSAGGVTVDELLALTGPSFLTMDPPRHELLREIVREPFRPKAVAALAACVGAHARRLLDGLEADRVDVTAAFARRLPVLVICEMLGLPTRDEPVLKTW
jgi:cytochrome P450